MMSPLIYSGSKARGGAVRNRFRSTTVLLISSVVAVGCITVGSQFRPDAVELIEMVHNEDPGRIALGNTLANR